MIWSELTVSHAPTWHRALHCHGKFSEFVVNRLLLGVRKVRIHILVLQLLNSYLWVRT